MSFALLLFCTGGTCPWCLLGPLHAVIDVLLHTSSIRPLSSITVSPVLQVPFENRNNRATVAIFKFESGAVGSLSHTLLLHGSDFFSELDVIADGFHAIVTDPYQNPGLRARLPGQDEYQQVSCQRTVLLQDV